MLVFWRFCLHVISTFRMTPITCVISFFNLLSCYASIIHPLFRIIFQINSPISFTLLLLCSSTPTSIPSSIFYSNSPSFNSFPCSLPSLHQHNGFSFSMLHHSMWSTTPESLRPRSKRVYLWILVWVTVRWQFLIYTASWGTQIFVRGSGAGRNAADAWFQYPEASALRRSAPSFDAREVSARGWLVACRLSYNYSLTTTRSSSSGGFDNQ